jgi:hypothetical protein
LRLSGETISPQILGVSFLAEWRNFQILLKMNEDQAKKRACDGCRIRKRKCDSKFPYCSNCIKTTARDENGNPICKYSIETKKRGPKKGYKESLLQRLESLEAILNPLDDTTSSYAEGSTDAWVNQSRRGSNMPVASNIQAFGDLGIPIMSLPEEEFELHLIRLGLQFCSLSSNYRLSLLMGEEFLFHQKSIHPSLRMALCANGLFYSQHANLYSLFDKNAEKPRIDTAKRFLKQAEAMLPKVYNNELEMIDSIRALMVMTDGYVAIGETEQGGRINAKIHQIIQFNHLFDPFIFNPIEKFGTTVDDLVELNQKFEIKAKAFIPPVLPEADIKERFQLWQECLVIDTFASMATSSPLELNETEYPTQFRNKALDFTTTEMNFTIPYEYNALCTPQLARNTIWGNTSMSSSFDDAREMTCLAALHYSSGLVMFRLSLVRNVRRAMRFSRETAVGAVHCFPHDTVSLIHSNSILQYESVPPIFMPFQSLQLFAPGSDTSSILINNMWRSYVSFNHDLLLSFSSFAYLHLPLVHLNEKKYKLSSLSTNEYSSMEILVTFLKAVSFIIRCLYTPNIGPNVTTQCPRVIENLSNSFLPDEIPAPGLASIEAAVAIYIVSSSCLEGCKANTTHRVEIIDLIQRCSLPALKRIGTVKPMGNLYFSKLKDMLQPFLGSNPIFFAIKTDRRDSFALVDNRGESSFDFNPFGRRESMQYHI